MSTTSSRPVGLDVLVIAGFWPAFLPTLPVRFGSVGYGLNIVVFCIELLGLGQSPVVLCQARYGRLQVGYGAILQHADFCLRLNNPGWG